VLQPTLKSLKSAKRTESGEYSLVSVDEKKEESASSPLDPEAPPALKLLKGILFKSDRPYRCSLGLHNNISCNGSGLIVSSFSVSGIASVYEWSSLAALFDECFVHSMIIKFQPFNITGVGPSLGGGAALVTVTGASTLAQGIQNCGMIIAGYFSATGSVSTAAGMTANPNHRIVHSAKAFTYSWRNNVRFDPHGISLDPLTSVGWNGWVFVASVGEMGGFVQMRGINDVVLAAAAVLGTFELMYDVSFRARS
jgi:hypothetical protein